MPLYSHFSKLIFFFIIFDERSRASDVCTISSKINKAALVENATAGIIQHLHIMVFKKTIRFQPARKICLKAS